MYVHAFYVSFIIDLALYCSTCAPLCVLYCCSISQDYVVALPPSEGLKCWETGHCLGLKMCEMT